MNVKSSMLLLNWQISAKSCTKPKSKPDCPFTDTLPPIQTVSTHQCHNHLSDILEHSCLHLCENAKSTWAVLICAHLRKSMYRNDREIVTLLAEELNCNNTMAQHEMYSHALFSSGCDPAGIIISTAHPSIVHVNKGWKSATVSYMYFLLFLL